MNRYQREWTRYYLLLIAVAVLTPSLLPLAHAVEPFAPNHRVLVMLGVVALWLIAFARAFVGLVWFPCPRCGRTFRGEPIQVHWSGRCFHCGLPLFGSGPKPSS